MVRRRLSRALFPLLGCLTVGMFVAVATARAEDLACADDGDCEDAQGCTGQETCDPVFLVCRSGMPLDCDDGNDCTFDTCLEPGYCTSTAVAEGTPCDDGVACSFADACRSGTCAAAGSDLDRSGTCDQDEAGDITVTSTALKAQRDGNGAGQASAKAAFVSGAPPQGIDFGQAVSVAIADLGSRGATLSFAAGDCVAKGSGIRCSTADRAAKATFRADPDVADGVRMVANFRRLAIEGPLSGPLTVSVTDAAGNVRFGSIATCDGDPSAIRCR